MLPISVLIYVALTLLIGFWANRRIATAGDFINTGRHLHPALNTAALFALWFGSETLFGASAEFAESGFPGVIEDPFGGVLCLLLVGLFYARRMYRLNVYTVGDIFRSHYGPRTELLCAVLMILSFFGYAGAQFVALGLVVQSLFGVSLAVGMTLSALVVVAYTFAGGMWAVSLTDFVQSILIVFGLVLIAVFITPMAGGWEGIAGAVPEAHWRFSPEPGAVSWINWLTAWMVLGLGSIASQDIFQRVNSARSERAAYGSTLAGAGLYLVFAMIPLYLVAAVRVIDPGLLEGDLQLALPGLVQQTMPLWVQIVFFGSLLSAIMSTGSGAVLAPATVLSENVLKDHLMSGLNERQSLLVTRLCVLAIGAVSLAMAFGSQNVFYLVRQASAVGLVSFFIPFSAALFFGSRSAVGAVVAMVLGSLVWTWFEFVQPLPIDALVPGTLASLLGMLGGALWDRQAGGATANT
jgi:SSS family solute:Na+ symporter